MVVINLLLTSYYLGCAFPHFPGVICRNAIHAAVVCLRRRLLLVVVFTRFLH